MIWRLVTKYTAVRPLEPNNERTPWETITQRGWQHLRDDWRMYGPAVFWHNLRMTLFRW